MTPAAPCRFSSWLVASALLVLWRLAAAPIEVPALAAPMPEASPNRPTTGYAEASAPALPEPGDTPRDPAAAPDDLLRRLLADPVAAEDAFINHRHLLRILDAEQLEMLAKATAKVRVFDGRQASRETLVGHYARMPPIDSYLEHFGKVLSPHDEEVVQRIWDTRKVRVEELAGELFDEGAACARRTWDDGDVLFWKQGEPKPSWSSPQTEGSHMKWESSGGIGGFVYHFRFNSAEHPVVDAKYAELLAEKSAAMEEIRKYIEAL